MSVYVLAQHPFHKQRYLIADPKKVSVEWRLSPKELKIDHEYQEDLTNIIRGPSDAKQDILKFIWNVKDKNFESVLFQYIRSTMKYNLDLFGNLLLNNKKIGSFPDALNEKEINLLKSELLKGVIFIIEKSPDSLILRKLSVNTRNPDIGMSTNKNMRSVKQVPKTTESDNLESYLLSLIQKPLVPLKESVDKIERRTQELIFIRETIQRLEARIVNLSIGSLTNTDKSTSNEELEQLKIMLMESRQRQSSLEMALSDANHRLATAEIRIIDKLKNSFNEPLIQMQVYSDPNHNFNLLFNNFFNMLKDAINYLPENENFYNVNEYINILELTKEQIDHLLHTMELLIQAFISIGWLPKR